MKLMNVLPRNDGTKISIGYASVLYKRPRFFLCKMLFAIGGALVFICLSGDFTMRYLEGEKQLASLKGIWCGTCLDAARKRIHASPEQDLPLAIFSAGVGLVFGIQAVRLKIAGALAKSANL
jgi:hypothetical protein